MGCPFLFGGQQYESIYTKDKQGIMEIENSLKAEQAFVGGLIECTALTEEMLWSI